MVKPCAFGSISLQGLVLLKEFEEKTFAGE